jgi:AmmeMemoRadiSam system protein A
VIEPAVPEADGAALARRAAAAVAAKLAGRPTDGRLPATSAQRAVGATFVTLESAGALLGCIGSLEPSRPRYLDAMRNAVRAAADPRLPPVTAEEWPCVDVTVSVLGPPEPLPVDGPDDLLAQLRPGVDGLTLSEGRRRATFLPVVWHKLPEPERFVAALLDKGGWSRALGFRGMPAARDWPKGLAVERYPATEFTDPAPRPPVRTADHAAG